MWHSLPWTAFDLLHSIFCVDFGSRWDECVKGVSDMRPYYATLPPTKSICNLGHTQDSPSARWRFLEIFFEIALSLIVIICNPGLVELDWIFFGWISHYWVEEKKNNLSGIHFLNLEFKSNSFCFLRAWKIDWCEIWANCSCYNSVLLISCAISSYHSNLKSYWLKSKMDASFAKPAILKHCPNLCPTSCIPPATFWPPERPQSTYLVNRTV